MNCKQGDLAIVIKSFAGNEGKIVRCVRLLGVHNWREPSGRRVKEWTWEIDRELPGCFGIPTREISDDLLRPLRPGDTEDETPTEIIRILSEGITA